MGCTHFACARANKGRYRRALTTLRLLGDGRNREVGTDPSCPATSSWSVQSARLLIG